MPTASSPASRDADDAAVEPFDRQTRAGLGDRLVAEVLARTEVDLRGSRLLCGDDIGVSTSALYPAYFELTRVYG